MTMQEVLFGAVRAWQRRRVLFAVLRSTGSDWIDQVFRTASDTMPFAPQLRTPFSQHATSHRAIRAYMRNVSRVPMEFFRTGSDVVDTDHPINRVFTRPNELMRGTQLFESLTGDLEIWGNGLWLLGDPVTMTRGEVVPASIRRLHPPRTKVKLDDNDEPVSYEYTNAKGRRYTFPAERVAHFKDWNPYDETWGQSWLEAVADEIEADWYAQKWDKRFFLNGAEPGFVMYPEGDFSIKDDKAKRLREAWVQEHGGLGRAHGPAILPRGMKIERTGIGQKDMDFVNLRRFSREQTLSGAGTPPAIAGILEYANYANMTPQLKIFFHLEVFPRLRMIESVVQADVLDRYGIRLECYFKDEVLLALADEFGNKVDSASKLVSIGVPLAEANSRLEMGMDLSKVPTAEQAFLSSSLVPADQAGAQFLVPPAAAPSAPAPAQAPKKPPSDGSEAPPAGEEPEPGEEAGPRPVARGSVENEAVWRRLVRHTDDLVLKANIRWRALVNDLQRETLRGLASAEKAVVTRLAASEVGDVVFDQKDAAQEAVVTMEPIWRASIVRGAETLVEEVGVSIDVHLNDPAVSAILRGRRQEIVGTTERMAAELRELLNDSVEQGASEADIRKQVLDFFSGERANARTVARTEVHSSFSAGRFHAMDEAGIRRHRWITARDVRVRETHEDLEGQVRDVGDEFANRLRFPLDPAGDPGEVINCRCVTVPA